MTEFHRLIVSSHATPNITEKIWFDRRYVASMTSPSLNSQSEVSELGVSFLPPHLWPGSHQDATFAYFYIGEQALPGSRYTFSPAENSLWINSASVWAVEEYKSYARLHFLPNSGIPTLAEGLVVLIAGQEPGHYESDNSPRAVAKKLNITLQES